jgi:hypothetical protein
MYPNLTPDLARAKLNDRLARGEAQQFAATAKRSRPSRRHQRLTAISVTMQALLARLQARRPAVSTVRTQT